jgi:hypothetical protein
MFFSAGAGLLGNLAPVRKSFDFNSLATLAPIRADARADKGSSSASSDVSIFHTMAYNSEKAIPRLCVHVLKCAYDVLTVLNEMQTSVGDRIQ